LVVLDMAFMFVVAEIAASSFAEMVIMPALTTP